MNIDSLVFLIWSNCRKNILRLSLVVMLFLFEANLCFDTILIVVIICYYLDHKLLFWCIISYLEMYKVVDEASESGEEERELSYERNKTNGVWSICRTRAFMYNVLFLVPLYISRRTMQHFSCFLLSNLSIKNCCNM